MMLLGGAVEVEDEDEEEGRVRVVVRCEGKSLGVAVRDGIVGSLWFGLGWLVRPGWLGRSSHGA